MLAYLCVIASPDDDLRLGRIINNPPRGIGAKSIETAAAIAHENNCSLFSVISKADLYPDLSRAAPRMLLFAGMINELMAQKDELARTFCTISLLSAPDICACLKKSTPLRMMRALRT